MIEIKTIILPLNQSGVADPIDSQLVNKHLRELNKENYFSSNHTIILGSRPNVISGSDGRIYAKEDCKFESIIMTQLSN